MIREKQSLRKFILGKSSPDIASSTEKRSYRKNIEKSLIVSLVLSLLFFRLTADLDVERYMVEEESIKFEFIDIPEIPPPTEQPPQQLKMEQVVEIEPEEIEQDDGGEIEEIIEEIEELLAEESNEELALNADMGYLLSDSPLDVSERGSLNIRNRLTSADDNISFGRGNEYLTADGDALDIGSTGTSRRQVEIAHASLDLPVEKEPQPRRDIPKPRDDGEPTLGIDEQPARVLSFSSSTIGTEDYRLWNKIISELDRLNKGWYGVNSDKLKRNHRGFSIQFGFNDQIRQEIHWRNDGNVWIKIIGNSTKSTSQELQRALSGLLRLSL